MDGFSFGREVEESKFRIRKLLALRTRLKSRMMDVQNKFNEFVLNQVARGDRKDFRQIFKAVSTNINLGRKFRKSENQKIRKPENQKTRKPEEKIFFKKNPNIRKSENPKIRKSENQKNSALRPTSYRNLSKWSVSSFRRSSSSCARSCIIRILFPKRWSTDSPVPTSMGSFSLRRILKRNSFLKKIRKSENQKTRK